MKYMSSFEEFPQKELYDLVKKLSDKQIFPDYRYKRSTNGDWKLHFFPYQYSVVEYKDLNNDYKTIPKELEEIIKKKINDLHEFGILHGDLHGENVLFEITSKGEYDVRIIGFDFSTKRNGFQKTKYIKDITPEDFKNYSNFWAVDKPIESIEELLAFEKDMWKF